MIKSFSSSSSLWFRVILPICFICFLYLCSFNSYLCATNSLIYSTVCLLYENESFCSKIDRNKSLRITQELIQKLIIDLKYNYLLLAFFILLLSLGFYEIFRMNSSSIIYLYLHYIYHLMIQNRQLILLVNN